MEYSFAAPARVNPWANLFEDRRERIAGISDEEILAWVREDNCHHREGGNQLARRLAELPAGWDANGDGKWDGFVPDLHFNFDAEGWDRSATGEPSGWRAFAYRPLPGAFWPVNGGSAGDVMIRLPEAFRKDAEGNDDLVVYATNLALVQAMIERRDQTIPETDERRVGVDLDKDGKLSRATRVVYDWAPLKGRDMKWAGLAGTVDPEEAPMAAGLYPVGTEFAHSLRYLDVQEGEGGEKRVVMGPRMKELRYTRKRRWLTYSELEQQYAAEAKEKEDFPDRLRTLWGDFEHGVPNGQGWVYQGFIEDAYGELRPQTVGETQACVGCHSGVGATQDGIFSFGRKLGADSFQAGWYHWSQKDISGTPDAIGRDGRGEYLSYLQRLGSFDEARSYATGIDAWLDPAGKAAPAAAARVAEDVAALIVPTAERALQLAKAYRTIVRDQDFVLGRDPNLGSLEATIWREVPADEKTGVETALPGESWKGLEVAAARVDAAPRDSGGAVQRDSPAG